MATFNLTSQADTITGTASDDTITGGTAALQSVDVIDGGGGRDKLESGTDPNGTQAPRISDVENIVLDTAGLPFSLANVSGARVISTDEASIISRRSERPNSNTPTVRSACSRARWTSASWAARWKATTTR